MSRERHLLLIDDSGLTACRHHAGCLTESTRFTTDGDSLAGFVAYLQRHRRRRFSVIANLADESLRLESIPATHGRDRRALIARRLSRHFPSCPHTLWLPLGRNRQTANEERLLLVALPPSPRLSPWLDALHAANARTGALHTPGLLAVPLAERLLGPRPSCLLVARWGHGLHQSHIVRGRLAFARRVPLRDDGDDPGETVIAESVRLHQYLDTQGLLPDEGPLRLLVIADVAAMPLPALPEADSGRFLLDRRDAGDCLRQLGIEATAAGTAHGPAVACFLHALALAPGTPGLSLPALQRAGRLRRSGNAILAAAFAVLVAAAIFAALRGQNTQSLREASAQLQAQLAARPPPRKSAASLPPGLPAASTATQRQLLERYESIRRNRPSPDNALRQLAGTFERFPGIVPVRLDWQADYRRGAPGEPPGERLHLIAAIERPPFPSTFSESDEAPGMDDETMPPAQAEWERFASALRRQTGADVRHTPLADGREGSPTNASFDVRFTHQASASPTYR